MINNLDPDNPKKEYTGVWIPKEVMECKELTPTDKIVYGEIACFQRCYGSNKWLAERICKSEVTASRCVSKLVKLGFVRFDGVKGNVRFIKAYQRRQSTSSTTKGVITDDKAVLSSTTNIDKSIDKKLDNVDTNVSTDESSVVLAASKKNPDIDQAFLMWEEVMGYPLHETKKERYSVNTILRRKEMDLDKLRVILRLVEASQHDKYKRFSISSFTDLMYKTNELRAWAKEKYAQQQSNQTVARI